jgi:hypothetical protein
LWRLRFTTADWLLVAWCRPFPADKERLEVTDSVEAAALGRGSFGYVFAVRHTLDAQNYALKVGRCTLNPVEARVERNWWQRLKLKYGELLSSFAFNDFNLRRSIKVIDMKELRWGGAGWQYKNPSWKRAWFHRLKLQFH